MRIYAELPAHRARQIFGDLFVGAWIWLWAWIGRAVTRSIAVLAEPARLLQDAGSDIAIRADSAGRQVAGVPVVGRALSGPFRSLEEMGRSLQATGASQQDAVQDIALWLGILTACLPILFVFYRWAVRRWAWVREASAAERLRREPGALQLFAIRAIATTPLAELRRMSGNPAESYLSGHYGPLAALELNRLGLRSAASGN